MRAFWANLILAGILVASTRSAEQLVNGLSVIVNDAVITYKDVVQYVAPAIELLVRQYRDRPDVLREKITQAQRDGLEQLIERKLILQEFKDAGYKLPDYVVDEEVQRRIRKQFGGDRVALVRTLQSRGMTFEAWRRRVREDLIISAMRARKLGGEVVVSP
ncbi:MAG: SurA N-terminal domain-containing protein, partial [Verrucomicrobia bacterium]|nr:SurA N-terminal domain-containing protein [Verrucomicrobiota bacterium]